MKKESTRFKSGLKFDLIPGENGTAKMAYIRIEDLDKNYLGSIDNENLKALKTVHRWIAEILRENK